MSKKTSKKAGKSKTNKSAKIRALTKLGKTVEQIAKQVGVPKNYVYTVQWQDKNKKANKKAAKKVAKKAKAVKAVKATTDAIQENLDTAWRVAGELPILHPVPEPIPFRPRGISNDEFQLAKFLDDSGASFTSGRVVELLLKDAVTVEDELQNLHYARDFIDSQIERLNAEAF